MSWWPFSLFTKIVLDDECVEVPEEDVYRGDDSVLYYDADGIQYSSAIDDDEFEIDP